MIFKVFFTHIKKVCTVSNQFCEKYVRYPDSGLSESISKKKNFI